MSAFNVVLGCVMALLIILFTISSIARYYIKFTLFVVLSLVFASAPLPLMLLKPFDPKNALIPASLLRLTARSLGIRWTVRGLDNIDNSRGAVVLLNHQSGIDLYVLAVLWPLMSRCTVVAKRSLQYLIPFGTATWMWGTVFIDRGAQSAREALNKQANAIRNEKRKLLLFPEGTRHGGDKLLPFRKGAFHVAMAASAPIQPIVVSKYHFLDTKRRRFGSGTRHSGDKLLPFRKGAFHVAMAASAPIQPIVVSKYHFLDTKRRRFGSGEIIITIMPLIETEGVDKEHITSLVEKVQMNMQEEFARTSAETLARRAKFVEH